MKGSLVRWRAGFLLALGLASAFLPFAAAEARDELADALPAPSESWRDQAPGEDRAAPNQLIVRFRSRLTQAQAGAALGSLPGSARILREARTTPQLLARAGGGASVLDRMAVLTLAPGADLPQAVRQIESMLDVLYAEPNFRIQLAGEGEKIPDDFEFGKLWSLRNTGQTGGKSGADIRAPNAWAWGVGSREMVVAVIDTGIDFFHPDLADNIWSNPAEIPGNGIDDDGNGYVDDIHGYDFISDDSDPMDDNNHGTHVAGIIAGAGNNQRGITGVAWEASLMGLKAFDEAGNSYADDVAVAIRYATENGAKIINASWGSADKSRAIEEVVAEARAAGLLVIAAAGNDRKDILFYPAAYPGVLTVGATDHNDARAPFSNHGKNVDVAAPGEFIFSTVPNNTYEISSGTSMAAPHVTGVAALIMARHPEFSADDVANILRSAVDPISPDKYLGSGRINALAAAQVIAPLPLVELNIPETVQGRMDFRGRASGAQYAGYSLSWGEGTYPTNWTEFFRADGPPVNGLFYTNFSLGEFADGPRAFRVTAYNTNGQSSFAQAAAQVRNVVITSPDHSDIFRAGEVIPLRGTVFGQDRVYRIEHGLGRMPTEWSSEGITLTDSGKTQQVDAILGYWDTRLAQTNAFYTLRLTATSPGGQTAEYRVALVYLEEKLKPGWPQHLAIEGEFPAKDWRTPVVTDLDGDGRQEIILVDPGNEQGKPARLLVYEHNGALRWARELGKGLPYMDVPVTGDLDGDGRPEIVTEAGSNWVVRAFKGDGTQLARGWPVRLDAGNWGKTLADLDGDGTLEMIALAQQGGMRGSREVRQLVVIGSDGDIRQRWEFSFCQPESNAPELLPVAANFDADPDLEIVAVTGCNEISLFDLKEPLRPVWSATTQGEITASPVAGDLTGDGENDIVLGVRKSGDFALGGGLYAWDGRGRLRPGWPVLLDESFTYAAALADFDGDGRAEIVVPGHEKLHLLRGHGFDVPGWPVASSNNWTLRSSAAIGDVDGDGALDVVFASPGFQHVAALQGDLFRISGLKAWKFNGAPIDLSPNPSLSGPPVEGLTSEVYQKSPAAVLTDLDGNGKLDVVTASVQQGAYALPGGQSRIKQRSSIYAWELNAPYNPALAPWSGLQGGAGHNGFWGVLPQPNTPPELSSIPGQIIIPGGFFNPVELDGYVQDDYDAPRQIVWTAQAGPQLRVSIGTNRVAVITAANSAWTGAEDVIFTATDSGGLARSVTARFEVSASYVPLGTAPDTAVIQEDTPLILDLLANDEASLGLAITGLSRPALGMAIIRPDGRVEYTPQENAAGADSFVYAARDAAGRMGQNRVTIEIQPVNDAPLPGAHRAITQEDTAAEILAYELDTDPDGDALQIAQFTQPANGAVTLPGPGRFTYRPKANFNGLDAFTYLLADPSGATATGQVSVLVKPVNDLPAATNQSFIINKNIPQNLSFLGGDVDGDTVKFRILKEPQHGELLAFPASGTYTPHRDFSGADSFSYVANDGQADSAEAFVNFTILNTNNIPEAASRSVTVKLGRSARITLEGKDADLDPLEFHITQPPAQGTLTGSGSNYVYQPNGLETLKDQIGYAASDGVSTSQVAFVSITLTDKNTAPAALDSFTDARLNTPTELVLNATDGESDALNYTLLTPPQRGAISSEGGKWIYTPHRDFAGMDRLTYKASDGELESASATVVISVSVLNHAPVVTNQTVRVLRNRSAAFALAVTDEDGNPLRAPIFKGPQFGRLAGTGTQFTYTPRQDFTGNDSFTYKVWDGETYSKLGRVDVIVSLNRQPVAFERVDTLPGGETRLLLRNTPGLNLQVSASTNLLQWTTLFNLKPPGAPTEVIDTNAPAHPRRFYRAAEFE